MPKKELQLVKPRNKVLFNEKSTYYGFVRRILAIYRYSGFLSISGLTNKTSEFTRGTLKSWYSTIHISVLLLQGIRLILMILDIFQAKGRVEIMDKFVILLITMANYINLLFMLRFSLKWEQFVKQVEAIEELLPSTNHQKKISFTLYLIAAILFISVADLIYLYFVIWRIIGGCIQSFDEYKTFVTLLQVVHSWLFKYFSFHYIWTPLLLILHLQMHILWSYVDIFIMIVAIYLSCKFEDFNKIVSIKLKDSGRGIANWSQLQVHYTQLSSLVTLIDDNISPTVLLSYFSNLLYIVKQIFYITKNTKRSLIVGNVTCIVLGNDVFSVTYFTCSCCFVIMRTGLISYFASSLNSASREPLQALHTFPSSSFNVDMQRLMTQVYYSKVSLTGYTFFGITRGMILAMVGTLITYELVLFQL